MKQAQQDFLLQIDPMQKLDNLLEQFPAGAIAHCAAGEKEALPSIELNGLVLIGPEGDFSAREIELALKSGYKAVHLGESRLRTETAGIVATTLAITAKQL